MTKKTNEIKTVDVKEVLNLAHHKHIIDAFVTDVNPDPEVVVAIVARVRLADIKRNQGWKAIVRDAKRSTLYDCVEIITGPENRMPSDSTEIHLPSGKYYEDYDGYNVELQKKYIKENGKKCSERYQQFYSEPVNPTIQD